jgi:hypothetical protein
MTTDHNSEIKYHEIASFRVLVVVIVLLAQKGLVLVEKPSFRA